MLVFQYSFRILLLECVCVCAHVCHRSNVTDIMWIQCRCRHLYKQEWVTPVLEIANHPPCALASIKHSGSILWFYVFFLFKPANSWVGSSQHTFIYLDHQTTIKKRSRRKVLGLNINARFVKCMFFDMLHPPSLPISMQMRVHTHFVLASVSSSGCRETKWNWSDESLPLSFIGDQTFCYGPSAHQNWMNLSARPGYSPDKILISPTRAALETRTV